MKARRSLRRTSLSAERLAGPTLPQARSQERAEEDWSRNNERPDSATLPRPRAISISAGKGPEAGPLQHRSPRARRISSTERSGGAKGPHPTPSQSGRWCERPRDDRDRGLDSSETPRVRRAQISTRPVHLRPSSENSDDRWCVADVPPKDLARDPEGSAGEATASMDGRILRWVCFGRASSAEFQRPTARPS